MLHINQTSLRLSTPYWCLTLIIFLCLIGGQVIAGISDDKWREVRSTNFIVYTDGGIKDAVSAAEMLELFRYTVLQITQGTSRLNSEPLKVFITKKARNFNILYGSDAADRVRATLNAFHHTRNGSIAITRARGRRLIRGNIYQIEDDVLAQEYITHLITRTFGELDYPIWYRAGLAEYLGNMKVT